MIEEIEIHGVGGIRSAELAFNGDFIVITGESGAGKSSLVRALEFIAGRRAQLNYIHTQEDSCEVRVVMTSPLIKGIAEKYQPQEQTLIARRVFSRSGKGKAYLQEQTVPLATLSHAMETNIVIQSQFAQLSLLDPLKQLELVDSCGGEELKNTLLELEKTFTDALAAEKEIFAVKKRRRESEKRFNDAPAVMRQVKSLGLTPESEAEWERELREIEKNEDTERAMRLIAEKLNGSECGILDQLEGVAAEIRALGSNKVSRWQDAVEKTLCSAQELFNVTEEICRGFTSAEEYETARDRLEKKTGALRKIKRTLNIASTAELMEYINEAEGELAWLNDSLTELDELEKKARSLRRETTRLAIEVRTQRKNAAQKLAAAVNAQLEGLGMGYANFGIEIEPLDKVRANGAENAVFTLTLPDGKPLPVGKNASGGELSRILIALQLTAGDDKIPGTLVFDEVEAGLGGKTALFAGEKLRELSKRCRTILITHQASIAAMADQHFVVRRSGDNTEIFEVSGEARASEIARMLSGDENSREAMEHARALLENNGEK